MNLVLLSGGSGKRLWPLSNDARSKQFLKVLNNNDNRESMVQRVWRQLSSAGLSKNSVIATSKSQEEIIKNHLNEDIPLVLEPERRDTFAAIALSTLYLYTVMGVELDEVVTILPVDPFVDDEFFERVKSLEYVLNTSGADMSLVGVKPTYPSEKYGYIIPEEFDENDDYLTVKRFTEKPDKEHAEEFISQDALWNCGVFAFKLGYIIEIIQNKGLPTNYYELYQQYSTIPKNSFDYEVVEKATNISAIPYEGNWKDLGTWNTLTEEMDEKVIGRGKIMYDSENSHLVNELEIPVNILGLSNIVVAASPDGILVSNKDFTPKIKEAIKGYDDIPMFEERQWGWFKILDYHKGQDQEDIITKKLCIQEGKNLSYQVHKYRDEHWTITKGKGLVVIDDQIFEVSPGDQVSVTRNTNHAIYADEELEIIEVQRGENLEEYDIDRLIKDWKGIETRVESLKTLV